MGEVLSEKRDVLNRWKEHFENLLNRDDPADKERTIAEIRAVSDNVNENSNYEYQQPSRERHGGHSGRNIKGHKPTKENKAPGVCNINAELLRDTEVSTEVWLHRVII